jgi:hypothetical protein
MKLCEYELSESEKQSKLEIEQAQTNILSKYSLEEIKNWKSVDLYLVIGIHSMRDYVEIDKKQLASIYKKVVVKYHPDNSEFPNEVYFLAQKAYQIIGDPVLRRQYDSIIFKDDFVEDKFYDKSEFFSTFGPIFRNYSKFSKKQPVPEFGSEDTKKEEVYNFYKFWNSFESWRSFEMQFAEDNLMNRYEKRSNEKMNKNKVQKMKNDEILRTKRLVGIAMKRDPRINEIKKSEVDENLLSGGWTEEEILVLKKLLKEFGMGVKNRFEVISKKMFERTGKKRNSKELFVKSNQLINN